MKAVPCCGVGSLSSVWPCRMSTGLAFSGDLLLRSHVLLLLRAKSVGLRDGDQGNATVRDRCSCVCILRPPALDATPRLADVRDLTGVLRRDVHVFSILAIERVALRQSTPARVLAPARVLGLQQGGPGHRQSVCRRLGGAAAPASIAKIASGRCGCRPERISPRGY